MKQTKIKSQSELRLIVNPIKKNIKLYQKAYRESNKEKIRKTKQVYCKAKSQENC